MVRFSWPVQYSRFAIAVINYDTEANGSKRYILSCFLIASSQRLPLMIICVCARLRQLGFTVCGVRLCAYVSMAPWIRNLFFLCMPRCLCRPGFAACVCLCIYMAMSPQLCIPGVYLRLHTSMSPWFSKGGVHVYVYMCMSYPLCFGCVSA